MDMLQKARAVDALGDLHISVTSSPCLSGQPWLASATGVEKKASAGDGILQGLCGYGLTPEDALDDLWDQILDVGRDGYLVVNATNKERRRHYRWQGFMWKEVPRP